MFAETHLTVNIGRRELQLMFLEWRLPVFGTYYTVEGALRYLTLMVENQQTAMFNPTSVSRLIDLLQTSHGDISRVIKAFRQLNAERMIEFYSDEEMTENRKTKMKTKCLHEWGVVYYVNGKSSTRNFIVWATLPIFAGGEKDTFLRMEDIAMNFYNPSFVTRVLSTPASQSVKDMNFPGVDTAGLLVLIQMPRGQFMSGLSFMELHADEMYSALTRAGINMYGSEQFLFTNEIPEFKSEQERKPFLRDIVQYERNERLRSFFRREDPSDSLLRPVVALVVIIQVCLTLPREL